MNHTYKGEVMPLRTATEVSKRPYSLTATEASQVFVKVKRFDGLTATECHQLVEQELKSLGLSCIQLDGFLSRFVYRCLQRTFLRSWLLPLSVEMANV